MKNIGTEAYHVVLIPQAPARTFYLDEYPEHGALEAALEYARKVGGRVYRNGQRVDEENFPIELK